MKSYVVLFIDRWPRKCWGIDSVIDHAGNIVINDHVSPSPIYAELFSINPAKVKAEVGVLT